MALTSTEEALVRQLLDQQAAILALAGNESTITSKLGATKVTLADLVAVSSLADADLLLTRQGTTDKSVTAAILAQYILAELAPDFVNVSGDTMTGALALFGGDTGVTPPQFDNDTSLATTAFVQRALGNKQGIASISTTTTLTASFAGKILNCSGVGSYTITLPPTSGLSDGAEFLFVSGSPSITVSKQGSGLIHFPGGSTASTIVLDTGDTAILQKITTNTWLLTGGSLVLKYAGNFAASLAGNGYQKLPSGLIIQWGSSNTSASGNVTITFPIAFPNASLSRSLVVQSNGAYVLWNETNTSSNMAVGGSNLSGTRVVFGFGWIAIGY